MGGQEQGGDPIGPGRVHIRAALLEQRPHGRLVLPGGGIHEPHIRFAGSR